MESLGIPHLGGSGLADMVERFCSCDGLDEKTFKIFVQFLRNEMSWIVSLGNTGIFL